MGNRSSGNVTSFRRTVMSSLPGTSRVCVSGFVGTKSVDPRKLHDYMVIVVSPSIFDLTFPIGEVPSGKLLTVLECLLLREIVRHVDAHHSFLLSARFGPRVNKTTEGQTLSPLEVLRSKDQIFMEDVLRGLTLASPHYPLFDDIPHTVPIQGSPTKEKTLLVPPFMTPDFVQGFMEQWDQLEAIPETGVVKFRGPAPRSYDRRTFLSDLASRLKAQEVAFLNEVLRWVLWKVGLAKLITIPELNPRHTSQEALLTKEDAARVKLMQEVVYPHDGIRPNINIRGIPSHWAKLPARLFVYGPILDLVNAFREKQIVKVCWNCGGLYQPHQTQYHREVQRYCSDTCRERAEEKRRYQKGRQTEKNSRGR